MKFLCGNCKAKYQIADEKASGRTLRMKCRRCGHDILIDGHTMPASAPPPGPTGRTASRTGASAVSVMPGAARGGSGVAPLPPRPPPPAPARPGPATRSKPPVSLSQDFRRHIAAPPEVPQRTAPYDLWHVAIQDVPVGPMTRDELGRKIDAGAVTADSLCWREGMDDWRPLGELPELAQLMRRPRGGDARSQRPPARSRTAPPVVPAPPRGSVFPATDFEEVDDEGSEPTRIADMTGGVPAMPAPAAASAQPRAAAAMGLGAQQPPSATGSLPGEASVAVPMPRREWRMSGSTGLALGLLVGILVVAGPTLYQQFWGQKQPPPTAQAAALPPPTTPAEDKTKTIDLEETDVAGEVNDTKGKPRVGAKAPRAGNSTPPKSGLTPEQEALLKRMRGEGGDVDVGRQERDLPSGGGGPTLTAQQLSGVVQNNKVQLQRCYESALRAVGGKQDGAIKITVAVTVGESGLVKSVSTKGNGLANMNDCMKSSVKRWRFPASGGESEFEFPLVFQPGA
jgi:predicted Zn finger-like uncharacterized protein